MQAPARPGSGPPELGREDKLILTRDECGVMENCGIVCGLWRPAPASLSSSPSVAPTGPALVTGNTKAPGKVYCVCVVS